MRKPFTTETATYLEDLPHPFERAADASCVTCATAVDDPRHVAWEQAAIAEKAHASPTMRWETGS